MGQSPLGETVSSVGDVPLLNGPTEFGSHHPCPVQFTSDARKLAQPGDILFCVRGSSTGRMNWADREYAIGRGLAAIRHHEDTSLQPLVRGVIELALPNLLAQATGSTFPNVSSQQIAAIPFPAISLEEQRAIAHVLGTLDDKIDLNRRMNETLEAMVRAFFQAWFVDFEPVRAKMEGRWRPGESLPGLPAEHYNLFPDTLVPSLLGDIPEGWEVRTLGDVVEVIKGHSYRSSELGDSRTALVTLKSIQRGGGYSPTGLKPYTGDYLPAQVVKAGDVVVAQTDVTQAAEVIGRTAFVSDSPEYRTLVASLDLLVVRPLPPLTKFYLYGMLQSQEFRIHVLSRVNGTTVLHMQRNALQEFRFPQPPRDVIAGFALEVLPLYENMALNEVESRTIAAQRDALLPRLVSGHVRVTDEGSHANNDD